MTTFADLTSALDDYRRVLVASGIRIDRLELEPGSATLGTSYRLWQDPPIGPTTLGATKTAARAAILERLQVVYDVIAALDTTTERPTP